MSDYDVLVTGADQRQGLAVIRALGSQGLRVFAAGLERKSIGFYSKYTRGFCQNPSPLADKKGYAEVILQKVKQHQIPMIIPVVESTIIALDEYREWFDGISRLALPSREILHRALDKDQTLAMATELGIPIPRSREVQSISEALAFAEEVGYPLVIKPRAMSSFGKAPSGFTFKVAYLKDSEDLKRTLQPFEKINTFPLFQEYCPGVKVAHGVLMADGELLGMYQYMGEREYPLTGGITSLHVSMALDPEMKAWSESLLRRMDWEGVAMVEYKVNLETGRKVLMEVNGRFWGTQSGANGLGLNFPYALYRYLQEGVKEKMPDTYPVGVRSQYMRGELTALLSRLNGAEQKSLAPLPGRLRAIWNVLADLRPGVQSDVMDLSDPVPGIREAQFLVMEYAELFARYLYRCLIRRRE